MKVVVFIIFVFSIGLTFSQEAYLCLLQSNESKREIGSRKFVNDNSNNLYITGVYHDSAVFNSSAFYSHGGLDVYIAKYTSEGELIWHRSAGGLKFDEPWDISISNNQIYVLGTFKDSIDFSTTGLWDGVTLYSDGAEDCFLACYDLEGEFKWAKRFGQFLFEYDKVNHPGISSNEDGVYLAVNIADSVNFNTPFDWSSNTIKRENSMKSCVVKYGLDGEILWIKEVKNSSNFTINDIDVTSNAIYTINSFVNEMHFQNIDNQETIIYSAGSTDICVAKYDVAGNFLWAKRAGGINTDTGKKIVVFEDDVYIVAYTNEFVNFNTPSQTGINEIQTSFGSPSLVVAKYDSDGNYKWANMANATKNYIEDIKANETGVYLNGHFENEMRFGFDLNLHENLKLKSQGFTDVFTCKFSSNGIPQWAKRSGGYSSDYSNGIVTGKNKVYNIGYFYGHSNFNTPSSWGSYELQTFNDVGTDTYLAAYCESELGIEEKIKKNNIILVYPNPSTGSFSLKVNNTNIQELNLLDNLGRKIETLNAKETKFELNLSKGVYFLEVITDVGRGLEKVVIE
jgi:hypothetical protein